MERLDNIQEIWLHKASWLWRIICIQIKRKYFSCHFSSISLSIPSCRTIHIVLMYTYGMKAKIGYRYFYLLVWNINQEYHYPHTYKIFYDMYKITGPYSPSLISLIAIFIICISSYTLYCTLDRVIKYHMHCNIISLTPRPLILISSSFCIVMWPMPKDRTHGTWHFVILNLSRRLHFDVMLHLKIILCFLYKHTCNSDIRYQLISSVILLINVSGQRFIRNDHDEVS